KKSEADVVEEPSTEPLASLILGPPPAPEPPRRPTPAPVAQIGPFTRTRFHFMSGMPAGETVNVRDDAGQIVLHYRSFASVTAVVAAVMAAIVIVSGAAAGVFLYSEERSEERRVGKGGRSGCGLDQ